MIDGFQIGELLTGECFLAGTDIYKRRVNF
jgi:hypothetical protein